MEAGKDLRQKEPLLYTGKGGVPALRLNHFECLLLLNKQQGKHRHGGKERPGYNICLRIFRTLGSK